MALLIVELDNISLPGRHGAMTFKVQLPDLEIRLWPERAS